MTKTKAKKPATTQQALAPGQRFMAPYELVTSPTIQSAVAIKEWGQFAGDVELPKLVEDLRTRVESVQSGDMQPIEAMLYGQAMTLETIFTSLAMRTTSQTGLKQFQTFMSLALKAQAQCRATLEALAEIKNPRAVAFVKQANISGGHQQVNNTAHNDQADERAGRGGIKTLEPQQDVTGCEVTQRLFPPNGDFQTANASVGPT